MAAVSLFWNTNIVGVTSYENALKRKMVVIKSRQTSKEATLFCAHTLPVNYVIGMLLPVSGMNSRSCLLCFPRYCAQSTPKWHEFYGSNGFRV